MATALDVLNVARSQIGFHEGANNENPYGIWYGIPNASYCAMGISWCFAQVGLSSLVAAQTPKGFAYCPAGLEWFQRQGLVVNKYQGQPGDLVFFSWGSGIAEHVEIIESASADGLTTIGFNTGNSNGSSSANGEGCYREHRPYLYVMAIVRPRYPVPLAPVSKGITSKKATAGVAATGTAVAGTAAAMHGMSSTTSSSKVVPTPTPTAFYAPPFPSTSNSFAIGQTNDAVLTIQKALVKKDILLAKYATGTMNTQTEAALVVFDKKAGIIVKAGTVPQIVYDNLKGSL
jgi:CHAP domain